MQPCGFTDFYGGTWIYEKRLIYYDSKVYRPKHEAAGLDEDDYDYDEADPYGDMETEEETEDEE